jgi:F-type H+-transporting ATPase subunit b
MSPEFLNQAAETLVTAIAFIIFFWVMKKYAWGPVTKVLDERQSRIERGFEEIKRKQEAAGALEHQLDERLRNIELEARARIQEAIADGRRLAGEITEKAHEEATQIAERARRNIELEIAKARVELRGEIVTMTIQASERLLRERLDETEQRRLVGAFIDDLERRSQS